MEKLKTWLVQLDSHFNKFSVFCEMEGKENQTIQKSSLSFRWAFRGPIERKHVILHCNKSLTAVNIWPELQNKTSQLDLRPRGHFLQHFLCLIASFNQLCWHTSQYSGGRSTYQLFQLRHLPNRWRYFDYLPKSSVIGFGFFLIR